MTGERTSADDRYIEVRRVKRFKQMFLSVQFDAVKTDEISQPIPAKQ